MTKELLDKFINSSCSEVEREFIYNWVADPGNKEEVSAIMKVSWDSVSRKMPEGVRSKESFLRRVLENNNDLLLKSSDENISPLLKVFQNDVVKKWALMKIAASIVLILGLSFVTYHYINVLPTEIAETTFIEKSNPKGQKSTIILPDGSKVKLNSSSKIRYSKKFTNTTREVILEGEAFFEVEKDKMRPFIVKTGDITTTVLGTSFNVSAYAKRDEIKIAVVTGKVEVKKSAYYSNGAATILHLTPSKMALYKRSERQLSSSPFNMEQEVGWKDGILIFKNADVNQIASQINAWYGLEVEIEPSKELKDKRYTGKFDNNSLEYILKAISYTSDLRFEIENNKVKLKQK